MGCSGRLRSRAADIPLPLGTGRYQKQQLPGRSPIGRLSGSRPKTPSTPWIDPNGSLRQPVDVLVGERRDVLDLARGDELLQVGPAAAAPAWQLQAFTALGAETRLYRCRVIPRSSEVLRLSQGHSRACPWIGALPGAVRALPGAVATFRRLRR